MTKLRTPLLSLDARGSIADSITFTKRRHAHIMEKKPTLKDQKTLLQIYHRWDYQDYAFQWQSLTPAQKQQWETDARRLKITGFNYWMRTKLTTLPDLVARWHLDEKTGGIAHDTSKNSLNGTISGAIPQPARIDYGLDFDAIDNYVDMGTPTLLALTDALSLECWIKFPYFTVNPFLIGRLTVWGQGYALWQTTVDRMTFIICTAGGTFDIATPALAQNTWHHFVGTYDKDAGANNHKLYQNGALVAQRTTVGAIVTSPNPFRLGRYQAWTPHPALLDEVRVYNRALTPQETLRHYSRGYPAN